MAQSTMHRITQFDISNVYNEHVDQRIVDIMQEKVQEYKDLINSKKPTEREELDEFEERRKTLYLDILYSNPAGFMLTAGMTTNYRQLKTIYKQRKNHRLPEWRMFCRWIETLPSSYLITRPITGGTDK